MESRRLVLVALTCAAFAGACHRSDNATPATAPAPTTAPPPAPAPKPALSDSDRSFFTQAAQAGTLEVEASKLAGTQASNAAVKTFATTMISDHTAAADELKALAAQKNVTLPENDAGPHNADLDSLKKLKGGAFDKAYAQKIGVAAHNEAVALFDGTSKNASDPDVKGFAAKTLPTLQHHLEMAKSLPHANDAAPKH